MSRITAALFALALAAPVTAQEWQVAREEFAYAGTRLTVRIEADAPGTLRLIRGEPGSVRVASRARQGFTTSGLAEDDELTLGAAGDGPVDYLVAVPENVWVDVRLPGRSLGESVPRGRSGTWEWNAADRPTRSPVTEWVPGAGDEPSADGPLYTTFSRDLAPATVAVPDLSVVARVTVRLEGQRFRVITSRPLSVEEGSPREVVIRPADPPMEVVLAVPAGTASFTLRLGGHTALLIDEQTVTTLCEPVTEQWLSNDRRWFTFNPRDGSLDCGGDSVQRHGG
ncbi:MAG: hypothetical protein ACN0LA_03250 [Candidatus Longimicrobiales bacterium M2_2A_002]